MRIWMWERNYKWIRLESDQGLDFMTIGLGALLQNDWHTKTVFVGSEGIEPSHRLYKSRVLPLNDEPVLV